MLRLTTEFVALSTSVYHFQVGLIKEIMRSNLFFGIILCLAWISPLFSHLHVTSWTDGSVFDFYLKVRSVVCTCSPYNSCYSFVRYRPILGSSFSVIFCARSHLIRCMTVYPFLFKFLCLFGKSS